MSDDNLIYDSFIVPEGTTQWTVNESESDQVVDGKYVLGRAVGPCFLPDGTSLNNRYYSRQLWESAISRNEERIANGEMLGTIGHEQPLDDQALLEGKASHRISKLWIDKSGVGMCEIHILGTTAGQQLNQYMRGGVRLKVSSRANGTIKGRNKAGASILDESTFKLTGFDFVQSPGVPTAIPILVESSTTENNEKSSLTEHDNMTTDNMERILAEKGKIEERLTNALEKVQEITESKNTTAKLLESRDAEITGLKTSLAESHAKVSEFESKLSESSTLLESYKALGTVESIKVTMDESKVLLEAYTTYGTPDQLAKAFEKFENVVADFKSLGKVEEVEESLKLAKEYSELGSLEKFRELLESNEKYSSLGSLKDLDENLALLAEYSKLGSIADIQKVFESTQSIIDKVAIDEKNSNINKLVDTYGVTQELAESLYNKNTYDECVAIIEGLQKKDVSSRYAKDDTKSPEKIVESHDNDSNTPQGNSASRLMSHHSR